MNTLHPAKARQVDTPRHPDRTALRTSKGTPEYMEWPNRQAMLKACEMQPKGIPGASQWKPYMEQKVPKT